MAYEQGHSVRQRSVMRRTWLHCLLLALPAILFAVLLAVQNHLTPLALVLLAVSLGLYLLLVVLSLLDTLTRPLQTLTNVVSSLREADYSFRARGARSGDALGELAAEINTLANILQRQRMESLEATALLSRILEVMHAPLFAFDRGMVLRLVNQAGAQLLEMPPGRCYGHTARELQLDGLLTAPDQSIQLFGLSPKRWLLRKAEFRQDGAPHTLLLLADVSQPLQEEEKSAWQRLVRVLGHEISNSLAPIKSIAGSLLGRVDRLTGDGITQRDFSRGLTVIEARADALHRFVQSYRVLAQLPAPQRKTLAIETIVERVALLERRVPVELEVGPAATLLGDQDQLEQMLINLVANAAEASLSNKALPIHMSWHLEGDDVVIRIRDHGSGISNVHNLFVPYYTTKPQGSGIGLALAQQIARAHGGEVQLTNCAEGPGALASVRLPLHASINS
jgi:two-component system nitrogen regulation sensor histidine kinase NtrY